jgi:hypothetical protein
MIGRPFLAGQWISSDYLDRVGGSSRDGGEEIAIAAGKTTDVLRFRPRSIPCGLNLDPVHRSPTNIIPNVCVKAAIYSASFLLRAAVAGELDIDPEEIEICNYRSLETDGAYIGEIALSDRLPNGAGFVSWISDNWENILESMLSRTPGPFAKQVISEEHRLKCDSACYDCIKVYRNMVYHGLLDWRLGMSYLRILGDPGYRAGLDGDFMHPELVDWIDLAEKVRNNFISQFHHYTPADWEGLPGFRAGELNVIVVHPLWDVRDPKGILMEAVAKAATDVRFLDTFNLLRRPGRCYEGLCRRSF